MRSSSALLIQRCRPSSSPWRASAGIRSKTTRSSSTSSATPSTKNEHQRLFKAADDVVVAETLRNAHIHGSIPSHVVASSDRPGDCQRCGKPLKPAPTVNSTNNLYSCEDCHTLYATTGGSGSASQKPDGKASDSSYLRRPPYPSEIAKFLDKYVVGQNEAKRTLSVGIYQHYKRLANNHEIKLQQAASINGQQQPQNGPISGSHHQSIPSGMLQPGTFNGNYGGPQGVTDSQTIAQLTFQNTTNSVSRTPAYTPGGNFTYSHLQQEDEGIRLEKSNIMLLGPSGVGKTFITQVLAKILDVPIALCDCTSMTQAGYVGEDVESVLQKLLQNAQGIVERAQQGIVFLDEVDKIAATGESASHAYRDVSGEGVQHALLKLVEGTVVNVKSGRKAPGQQDTVPMDTSDVLFVSSGAFSGLEKIVGKRLDKRAVGFGNASNFHSITNDDAVNQQLMNEKRDKLFSQADQGDLIKFGMVPELVGRFPVLVPFHSFNKDMLVRVLTEPKNSLLAQMKLQFSLDSVELDFANDALEEIAQQALERKTGARALRSIIEKVLLLAKFEVPGTDIDSVHINRDCVKGTGSYVYRRREESPRKLAAAGCA